jgi:hypothetical protein
LTRKALGLIHLRTLAASTFTSHGIGLDYAHKKYSSQQVVEYWITLARRVVADTSKRPEQPERTPGVQ